MELSLVVALNMMDEAVHHGVKIDRRALERELGVPVLQAIAVEGKGIDELKAALPRAATGNKVPQIAALVEPWRDRFPSAAEALLYLEDDYSVRPSRPAAKEKRRQEEIYLLRRRRVNEIVAAVVKESTAVDSFRPGLAG